MWRWGNTCSRTYHQGHSPIQKGNRKGKTVVLTFLFVKAYLNLSECDCESNSVWRVRRHFICLVQRNFTTVDRCGVNCHLSFLFFRSTRPLVVILFLVFFQTDWTPFWYFSDSFYWCIAFYPNPPQYTSWARNACWRNFAKFTTKDRANNVLVTQINEWSHCFQANTLMMFSIHGAVHSCCPAVQG